MAKHRVNKNLQLRNGMTVGNWKISRNLGHGGQSEVWEARVSTGVHHTIPRALKICLATDEQARARFSQEVELLQKYKHAHIIPVLESNLSWEQEIGPEEATFHGAYYVMPRAEGSIINIPHLVRDTLTVLRLFRDICLAIDFLHTQNEPVLHRDLKPDNILILDEPFRAVIGDFGIATPIESQGSLTKTNEVVGTHTYRAPEIYLGRSATKESDIYGLGRILERLLTDQEPQDVLPRPIPAERHLSDRARKSLTEIMKRACAHAPENRFHSARDIISSLPNFIIDVSAPHEKTEPIHYRGAGGSGPDGSSKSPEAVQPGQEMSYAELKMAFPKLRKNGSLLRAPVEISNVGHGTARACSISLSVGDILLQELPLDPIPGNGKATQHIAARLPERPAADSQVVLSISYENIYGNKFTTSYSLARWNGHQFELQYKRI